MSKRNTYGLKNTDWASFSLFLGLIAIGWLMIYAVSYSREMTLADVGFFSSSAGKQLIWIGISFFVFAIILFIDWRFWQTFAYPIYAFGIFLLLAVLIAGTEIKGARAWFSFGGFSFQPSEIAKFATCLAVSAFLSHYRTNLKGIRSQVLAFGIMLLPMGLILMQPDAGSAIVFLSFLVVLFREGLSQNYYVIGFFTATVLILGLLFNPIYIVIALSLIGVFVLVYQFKAQTRYWILGAMALSVGTYFAVIQNWAFQAMLLLLGIVAIFSVVQWMRNKGRIVSLVTLALFAGAALSFASNFAFNNVLKPHQQDRINVWLRPQLTDRAGSSYNLWQSKLAIGSGGFLGKGFLQGTLTKLNYVPEQSTDFIFCTIGEEQGFIGSVGIIIIFFIFIYRITIVAERQRSNFSRHYAYCVAGILFVHVFINIGMTMGLLPIIGIPLPFISKGGSSLLGFTIMVAVLLKLDSNRFKI